MTNCELSEFLWVQKHNAIPVEFPGLRNKWQS